MVVQWLPMAEKNDAHENAQNVFFFFSLKLQLFWVSEMYILYYKATKKYLVIELPIYI